ncbi:MAG TPA: diguanylate cyclase, partial [Polyangiales bacterium]|nr:diguanylate cyclase [Polyangiales bacterium]
MPAADSKEDDDMDMLSSSTLTSAAVRTSTDSHVEQIKPGAGYAPTVLIVDDARSNRNTVAELLTSTGLAAKTLFAEDGLQAFKVMRSEPVDLVVCDVNMPRCDGLKFLRLKATDSAFEGIPVIVLTGAEDLTRKVQALTSGASDYVTKPFDAAELVARIGVHLKLRKLQSELIATNSELERLTLVDPLTEVSNRRAFTKKLEEEFVRARRYDRPLSLAMLDIDHFKQVNDTHGHPAGDSALIALATACKRMLRVNDFVARYGGEEFALILPETPGEGAALAMNRLRETIGREVVRSHDHSFSVTA